MLLAAVRRAVLADWISLNDINPDPESLSMRRGHDLGRVVAPNRDCCRTAWVTPCAPATTSAISTTTSADGRYSSTPEAVM